MSNYLFRNIVKTDVVVPAGTVNLPVLPKLVVNTLITLDNATVRTYDIGDLGTPTTSFNMASSGIDIAYDPVNDYILVSDNSPNEIRVYDLLGNLVDTLNPDVTAGGIVVNDEGNIIISHLLGYVASVYRSVTDFTKIDSITMPYFNNEVLCLDLDENLYSSDRNSGIVAKHEGLTSTVLDTINVFSVVNPIDSMDFNKEGNIQISKASSNQLRTFEEFSDTLLGSTGVGNNLKGFIYTKKYEQV